MPTKKSLVHALLEHMGHTGHHTAHHTGRKRAPTARNMAIGKLLHEGYTMAQANHKLGSGHTTGHHHHKKKL